MKSRNLGKFNQSKQVNFMDKGPHPSTKYRWDLNDMAIAFKLVDIKSLVGLFNEVNIISLVVDLNLLVEVIYVVKLAGFR